MPIVHVRLNRKHFAKLQKKQNFQLTHDQLQGKYPEEVMDVELELTPQHHKKFLKNLKNGKGHRFDVHHIKGGSFGSFFRKVGKTLAPIAKTLAPVVLPIASTALKGASDSYAPELAPITGALVDAGSQSALKAFGNGLRKGSPEAKAHMVRLRQMKRGEGFFGDLVKKGAKALAPIAIDQDKNFLNSTLQKYAPSSLQGIGSQLIDVAGNQAQNHVDGMGFHRKRHCGGSFSGGSFAGGVNYSPVLNSNSPYFHDQRFIAPARGSAVGGSFRQ